MPQSKLKKEELKDKNTIFSYMYRDASNYKFHGYVVFEGLPEADCEDKIKTALESSSYFIANQVDIPDLFPFLGQYDCQLPGIKIPGM